MNNSRKLLKVGSVIKPHGIRGELFVNFYERFVPYIDKVYFEDRNALNGPYRVLTIRKHKSGYILKVEGCDDRSSAERFRNHLIGIDIKLPEGCYYVDEIIGCRVYDSKNEFVGVVKEVWKLPAHDVYLITNADKEILLPAVKTYFNSIDVYNKRIDLSARADEVIK